MQNTNKTFSNIIMEKFRTGMVDEAFTSLAFKLSQMTSNMTVQEMDEINDCINDLGVALGGDDANTLYRFQFDEILVQNIETARANEVTHYLIGSMESIHNSMQTIAYK